MCGWQQVQTCRLSYFLAIFNLPRKFTRNRKWKLWTKRIINFWIKGISFLDVKDSSCCKFDNPKGWMGEALRDGRVTTQILNSLASMKNISGRLEVRDSKHGGKNCNWSEIDQENKFCSDFQVGNLSKNLPRNFEFLLGTN